MVKLKLGLIRYLRLLILGLIQHLIKRQLELLGLMILELIQQRRLLGLILQQRRILEQIVQQRRILEQIVRMMTLRQILQLLRILGLRLRLLRILGLRLQLLRILGQIVRLMILRQIQLLRILERMLLGLIQHLMKQQQWMMSLNFPLMMRR